MSRELDGYTNKFYWYIIDIKTGSAVIVYSLAAKAVFGKTRIQITPCFGVSSFWVDKKKLTEIINPVVRISNRQNGTVIDKQLVLDSGNGVHKLSPHLPNLTIQPTTDSLRELLGYDSTIKG